MSARALSRTLSSRYLRRINNFVSRAPRPITSMTLLCARSFHTDERISETFPLASRGSQFGSTSVVSSQTVGHSPRPRTRRCFSICADFRVLSSPTHFSHYLLLRRFYARLRRVYAPCVRPFTFTFRPCSSFPQLRSGEIGRVLNGVHTGPEDIHPYPTEVKGSRTPRRGWNYQFRFSLSPPAFLFSSPPSSLSFSFFFLEGTPTRCLSLAPLRNHAKTR